MSARIEDLAYILHKRAYKESSYIIEFFTRTHGVISAVAKGAKTSKSRFYLNLQLFTQLEIGLAGTSELLTLTQADVSKAVRMTAQKNIFCGYYVNELVLRLLHRHDQHSQLFDFYDRLIASLKDAAAPEPLLRHFEMALLTEIGYGVDFSCTVDGKAIKDEQYYLVSPEQGVTETTASQASDMRVSGKTLNDLVAGALSNDTSLRESKRLMRRILQYHLGHKPLKTRDLFAPTAGN
ncbi:MAG: DNA repair protein RecO [Gammaproteobacteria bacterium]